MPTLGLPHTPRQDLVTAQLYNVSIVDLLRLLTVVCIAY